VQKVSDTPPIYLYDFSGTPSTLKPLKQIGAYSETSDYSERVKLTLKKSDRGRKTVELALTLVVQAFGASAIIRTA
jgi:hypothetical protein